MATNVAVSQPTNTKQSRNANHPTDDTFLVLHNFIWRNASKPLTFLTFCFKPTNSFFLIQDLLLLFALPH